jgi:hypothetical protein
MAATTTHATPIPIPAAAPFDSELLPVEVLSEIEEVCEIKPEVVFDKFVLMVLLEDELATEEVSEAVEVALMLKPLTCMPNTIVGPVETAVDAGTVEVATPHGPPGVVDS